jgi:hypothetical protein
MYQVVVSFSSTFWSIYDLYYYKKVVWVMLIHTKIDLKIFILSDLQWESCLNRVQTFISNLCTILKLNP